MKNTLLLILLLSSVWSCRDKANNQLQKEGSVTETTSMVSKPDPTLQALLEFADITDTNNSSITERIAFKMVDIEGIASPLDLEKGVAFFKEFPKTTNQLNFPLMEIKGTERAILMTKGKGFGGPIWAMLLLDVGTLEIHKIKFGHKAETEGYGAKIVRADFQNQFTAKVVNMDTITFWLRQHGKKNSMGIYPIDGISGATVTSVAVINMLNEGLHGYSKYLKSSK